MSIATQINALTTDRNDIRTALINKGVTAASNHGFDDFATDISNIPGGSTPTGNIDILEDGLYDVTSYATATVKEFDESNYDCQYLTIENTSAYDGIVRIAHNKDATYNTSTIATADANQPTDYTFSWRRYRDGAWSEWENETIGWSLSGNLNMGFNCNPGEKVQFRSSDTRVFYSVTASSTSTSATVNYSRSIYYKSIYCYPATSGQAVTFSVYGNPLSMAIGDGFKKVRSCPDHGLYKLFVNNEYITDITNLVLPEEIGAHGCEGLFYLCTGITTAPTVNIKKVSDSACRSMFNACSSLTNISGITLSATGMAPYCYAYFFRGTAITTAPALPATTLATYCYNNMFYNCASLTIAPTMIINTVAEYCCDYMFWSCTSLTNISGITLAATTLESYCYRYMFSNCSSLTTAPALPATTLATYCYQYMFQSCAALVNVPTTLPATTLANYCYNNMFYGCTSLTTAPILPATTLKSNCYGNMFNSCSSLVWIKALFTTTPGTSYTQNWVQSVGSGGTFVKNSSATWTTSGVNGVPAGWTIEKASS